MQKTSPIKKLYYLVPLDLCEFVLRNKFFSPAQLYLCLKSKCDGKIRITTKLKRELAKEIGCTVRTIENNLLKLQKRNWIGFNPKSRIYFIRGFETLRKMEGFQRRTGVWWKVSYLKHTKAFFIGACLGYLSNRQKANKYNELKKEQSLSERKQEGSNQDRISLPTHYPIAAEAVSKIYGVSKSTAYQWKQLAKEQDFIDLRSNTKLISINPQDGYFFKVGYDEVSDHVFYDQFGRVWLKEIDKVAAKLEYKRRRKAI